MAEGEEYFLDKYNFKMCRGGLVGPPPDQGERSRRDILKATLAPTCDTCYCDNGAIALFRSGRAAVARADTHSRVTIMGYQNVRKGKRIKRERSVCGQFISMICRFFRQICRYWQAEEESYRKKSKKSFFTICFFEIQKIC